MQSRKPKRKEPLNPATVLLIRQLVKGGLVFGFVALVVTAVWYISRIPALTISTVTVSGTETIAAGEIEAAVLGVLEGTYLGLVPRRFAWLYPEAEVTTTVLAIPRIKNIELTHDDSTELVFSVTEYIPDALWCAYKSQDECFFLDETGYAFALAPQLSGGSLLRFFTLQTEPERGQNPFLETDYQAVKSFAAALAETGWFVRTIEIDAVRDAFFTLVPSGEIKLTLTADTAKSFSYLQSLRSSEEFKHLAPGNFQYLDLRFGAKVFVNEELPTTASSTASTSESVEVVTPE